MSVTRRTSGGEPSDIGVFVRTLGCKVNQVESGQIALELLGAGARLVAEDVADAIVVNTCTVTGEADAKARKAVRQALKAPSEPVVVVTGCLAALDREGFRALGSRVVVEARKEDVAERVLELLSPVRAAQTRSAATVEGIRAGEGFRSRLMVKIQDGCDAYCSYCIVPYARGIPRPVPLHRIVSEVEHARDAGVAEVVLTGINIGRYREGTARLAEVLEAVARTGIARLRISSIEPLDLTGELLDVLGALPNLCPHVHVPLQAGDDDVLRAMNRRYTTREYAERIAMVRDVLGPLAVTTDVIAGFPGESPGQAERTAAFCEEMGFARLHVFRYSQRAGTPAAADRNQIEPHERSARAARLRAVDADLRRRYVASRLGWVADALVERVDPRRSEGQGAGSMAEGTTEDYLKVSFPVRFAKPGDLVRVRLLSASEGRVAGEPEVT